MTTLEQLLEFKNQNPSLGEILLVGDLNARTGNLNFDPEEDEPEEDQESVPNSHPEPENRTSKDGVINSRGNLFLDFLACCKLSLLNGCFLGYILGEFTSINYNGASVVNYMAATPNLLESIESTSRLKSWNFRNSLTTNLVFASSNVKITWSTLMSSWNLLKMFRKVTNGHHAMKTCIIIS